MKIYWNGHSKNIIGNRLKELRTAQGISQKTLAARLQTENHLIFFSIFFSLNSAKGYRMCIP